MMRLASVALLAAGVALAGWWMGHMLFAALFEMLRDRDLEMALDSPQALALFEYAGAALGLASGAIAGWRLFRTRRSRPLWTIYLLAAIGGLGGFAFAQVADFGGLAITHLRVSKDSYIFVSVASWFFLLIIGCWVIATGEMRAMGVPKRAGHVIGPSILAFALIITGFIATRNTWETARNLGGTSSGWANIRFPAGIPRPDVKSIRAEMRTPLGAARAVPNEWREENGWPVLAVMIDFKPRTRDRLLVVTLPDQPPLVFKPPFPATPAVRFGYGPWIGIDGFLNEDGTIRRATARDDYAIRYMVTR